MLPSICYQLVPEPATHWLPALHRNVKLGPSFFIPNFQIGSFGAVTPFKSLLKNRSELWDVAAAGPLAGFTFSLALLLIGLDQSHPGALPQVGRGVGLWVDLCSG
jgi:hypothetical protein